MGLWDTRCGKCGYDYLLFLAWPRSQCPRCGEEIDDRLGYYSTRVYRAFLLTLPVVVLLLFFVLVPQVVSVPLWALIAIPLPVFGFLVAFQRWSIRLYRIIFLIYTALTELASFVIFTLLYFGIIYFALSIFDIQRYVNLWFIGGLALVIYAIIALPGKSLAEDDRWVARLARAYIFGFVFATPVFILEMVLLPGPFPVLGAVFLVIVFILLAYSKTWTYLHWDRFARTIAIIMIILVPGLLTIYSAISKMNINNNWLDLSSWACVLPAIIILLVFLVVAILAAKRTHAFSSRGFQKTVALAHELKQK